MEITEEIVLDYNSMPIDKTEGAFQRDVELTELLYKDQWLDIELELLPEFLKVQAV